MTGLPAVARTVINLVLVISLLVLSLPFTQFIRADCSLSGGNPDDCSNKIGQLNSQLASIQQQQSSLQSQLNSAQSNLNATQAQLNDFQSKANDVTNQLNKATDDLNNAQGILDKSKEMFKLRIRDMYERGILDRFQLFLGNNLSFQDSIELYALNSEVLHKNRNIIIQYTSTVKNLAITRDQIAQAKQTADQQLAQIQSIRNQQAAQVSNTRNTINSLNNQASQVKLALANLTSIQQALIQARSASFSTAIGSTPPTDDPNSSTTYDPGFRPAFAVFSFGAYTHRNGMSQYGAYGRATANPPQSYQQILQAYYPGATLTNTNSDPSITVNGTNEYGETFNNVNYDMETYLKHIYEVPTSWPMAVLEAQAIAARSFAWGKSTICPSQSCQEAKTELNTTAWQQAVAATAGVIMTGSSGYQYSSTSGGYLNTSGWDTSCGNMSCWPSGAYESTAGSPWFYKGWYKSVEDGQSCGRISPWLSQSEFTDLLNAWVVYSNGNSNDQSRVVQVDFNTCMPSLYQALGYNFTPQNPYSMSEMQARADQLGGSYHSVSSVSVGYNTGGYTGSMTVNTDRGTVVINGQQFQNILNLRLPGRLAAKTSLYNIESKF